MASKRFNFEDVPAKSFLSEETIQQDQQTDIPKGYKINPQYIETKSKAVHMLMQPSLHAKLKKQAEAEGTSVNNYMHEILKKAVEEKERK